MCLIEFFVVLFWVRVIFNIVTDCRCSSVLFLTITAVFVVSLCHIVGLLLPTRRLFICHGLSITACVGLPQN